MRDNTCSEVITMQMQLIATHHEGQYILRRDITMQMQLIATHHEGQCMLRSDITMQMQLIATHHEGQPIHAQKRYYNADAAYSYTS